MGLGSSEPRREVFYLAVRTKDANKQLDPHFEVTKRENNKTIKLNAETSVSGYLIGINHGKYEWPKDSKEYVETISLRLIDKGAEFKIECGVDTIIGRNIMNRIIGTHDWGWVTVRLYAKNEFAQIYIGNNDKPMEWKFNYEQDLKPLVESFPDPRKPEKTIVVYNKLNTLLMNEWVKCEALVRDNASKNPAIVEALKFGVVPAPATMPAPLPSTPAPEPNDGPVDDADLFDPPIDDTELPF